MRGKIDGTSYEGECACFVGTVANVAKQNYRSLTCGLKPESDSATERWFLAILKGDTPDNNQVSAITRDWIQEFTKVNGIELPSYKLVSSIDFPEVFKC